MSACGSSGPVLLVLAVAVAAAQVGGYPPGGYPPGTYPPTYPGGTRLPGQGRIPRVPIPKKGGKDSKKAEAEQPLPRFRGMLKRLDESEMTLEMGDHRVLDFKRNAKTRFFQKETEIKNPKFQAGDDISVEASQDAYGILTAVNVYWEAAAKSDGPQKDATVDTWADAPAAAPPIPEGNSSKSASAERKPTPSADPDDPGPPRLARGRPADAARQRSAEIPTQGTTPQLTSRAEPPAEIIAPARDRRVADEDLPPLPIGTRPADQLIRRASDAALEFTEGLPAYFCQEVIARFQSETRNPSWQAIDVVTTTVVYENGREEYRDIAINGKKTTKKIEETGGAWSTGEFGTLLIDLFSAATAADFRYQRDSRVSGINAKVYDFSVARENSHWQVHAGSQMYAPSYKGSVWIDPQTARVMRIEMQGKGFPEAFAIDHVEGAVDYQYIRLGDAKQYLLPVHAENLSCQRGSNFCSKNVIDFRNYHKYSGESKITFENPKE